MLACVWASACEGRYDLERTGADVKVTSAYTKCETDQDCTLVNVTCNGCCAQEAIQSSLEERFNEAKDSACDGYRGSECDCDPPAEVAVCKAGRCDAVPEPKPIPEPNPYTLERKDDRVEVTDVYTMCKSDDDCSLVNVTCNGCCDRESISSSLESKFDDEKELACSDYEGAICDCQELPLTAVCEDERCKTRDTCAMLEGAYASDEELECGLGQDGIVLCPWSLTFKPGDTFDWLHSDYGDHGSYSCKDGRITTSNGFTGEIREDGTVTFVDVTYHRI